MSFYLPTLHTDYSRSMSDPDDPAQFGMIDHTNIGPLLPDTLLLDPADIANAASTVDIDPPVEHYSVLINHAP